jgi:FKBP-type peptidyl-prolyl cis-trans isomerase FklB
MELIAMKTTKDKVSYCIGLETGRNIKRQFAEVDVNLLKDGFQDGIGGTAPKLSENEIQQILVALQQQIESQQREFVAKVAEENKKEGEAFLEQNKKQPGIVVTPSGLQYKVIQSGTGPKPTLLDEVKIHYRGTFIDGRIFDSTYEREEPVSLPVNRVIPGWSEVLQLMHEGDKWQVFIPSYLGYGEMGFGPEIGPNTTLIFEIELLKSKKDGLQG